METRRLKISVVIPAYNVREYLQKCIESVVQQTYSNIEVIVVDDGSRDGTSELCDSMMRKYPEIQVIHKSNGGLSDARNAGIHRASGDYIIFLDGDDFWDDKEAVSRLAARASVTGADVFNYSYQKYYETQGRKQPYFSGIENMPVEFAKGEDSIDYITSKGLYIASACNKMIRRELLDAGMEFSKGIFSEDIEWCARLLVKAASMDFVCENFYCYRQREGSISHSIDRTKCEHLCNNILACIHLAESCEAQRRASLLRYTAYQYATFFVIQSQVDAFPNELVEKLKPYCWILKYHCGNRKLVILDLCCKVMGYRKTCQGIRWMYRNVIWKTK